MSEKDLGRLTFVLPTLTEAELTGNPPAEETRRPLVVVGVTVRFPAGHEHDGRVLDKPEDILLDNKTASLVLGSGIGEFLNKATEEA